MRQSPGPEDFVEAVTRGVIRALQSGHDVSGYAAKPPGPIVAGIIFGRPRPDDLVMQPGTGGTLHGSFREPPGGQR